MYRFFSSSWIFPLITCLGVLLAALGWIHRHSRHFEGELFAVREQPEHLAVRPAASLRARGLAPGEIPFAHPGAASFLDPAVRHESRSLPFAVQVREVEVLKAPAPRDVLEIESGADTEAFPLETGAVIKPADAPLRVLELRPWGGLLRTPQGRPMASIAVTAADGTLETLGLLDAGQWLDIAPDLRVHFAWAGSEGEARAQLPPQLPGEEAARWGVADGRRIHWLRGLTPGSGMILDDGTEVTLLRVVRAGTETEEGVLSAPAILVELRGETDASRYWVGAGEENAPHGIRFEHPVAVAHVLLLRAWRDAGLLAAAYMDGSQVAIQALEEGGAWEAAEAFPYDLRVRQVVSAALPVADTGADIRELVLDTPEGVLELREGALVRHGALRLRYRRVPEPPVVAYRLAALPAGDGTAREFVLEPGRTVQLGRWRLGQATAEGAPAGVAVLRAEYVPGTGGLWAGLALGCAGVLGWFVTRRRGTRAPKVEAGATDAEPAHGTGRGAASHRPGL